MKNHIVPLKTYVFVWASLLGLLALTWGLSEFNLGPANTAVAMLIALVKMLIVMLFFMHVRYQARVMWLFATAGFFWFLIMVTLTLGDYLTRGNVRLGNDPKIAARMFSSPPGPQQ